MYNIYIYTHNHTYIPRVISDEIPPSEINAPLKCLLVMENPWLGLVVKEGGVQYLYSGRTL
jgi:hypothetical protein